VRRTRFVFAVAVIAMLALAAGAASAQDKDSLPPNLNEGTTLAKLGAEPTNEKASEPKTPSEAPTKEKSGASPKGSSPPPTPSLASEGIPVNGTPASGYTAPDGTRVPTGAVSSGGLARLPATGGA
jgi:hypothetical protein